MLKIYYLSVLVLTLFVNSVFAQRSIDFGTDTTFDVATWNLENFPKAGQTTIDYVSLLVEEMDIDLFALQEIESQSSFNSLVADLEGYEGYWAYYNYSGMAFLYKNEIVEIQNTYKILTTYTREFPRAPLVVEISVRGDSYIIIGNHFKCCGDGILDETDLWDEEKRRYDASVLLKEYVDTHFADDRVIMLGDFNDEILDDTDNNVFQPFLDIPLDFVFADLTVEQSSSSNWSYPSWPSHLDHILVSNEIFETFDNSLADIECLKPEVYFVGGWSGYDNDVSDHRPVALRMAMAPDTVGLENVSDIDFSIFPNPVSDYVTISSSVSNTEIEFYNSIGVLLKEFDITSKAVINISDLQPGFYFVKMNSGYSTQIKRLIIKR